MAMRTWVSPDGDAHDVSDEHLYKFCRARGLHYENMLDHIETATSNQKNGGWRLIERLEVYLVVRLLQPLERDASKRDVHATRIDRHR